MALFPCLQGAGGSAITAATLDATSPVSIDAGHIAVATAFQTAYGGTPSASITISGTQDVDYEILLDDTTTNFLIGQATAVAHHALVVKAINNITITLSATGGSNYPEGGTLVYDLS
jgi:hypothetical protein